MTALPIATFLAGALLSLLIPVLLLTALVVWYVMFLRRAPEATDAAEAAEPVAPVAIPGAANPAAGKE